jgi:di/tricarboxylate transporter
MVLATAFSLANILVTSMGAMLLMLLTGCLRLREAYRAIDARVLILIIGTLALGKALAKTGAADLYAGYFLSPFEGMNPWIVLSAFILLTSVLSLFLSNNSTAVLLIPIAISLAAGLGVDPRPFIVGVCFGASACYASPMGYQTNLLVYGPGGYRFLDYLKVGIPLNIWVWLMATIFIPLIWPF